MINIKPAYWSYRLSLEVIFISPFLSLFFYPGPFDGSWPLVHITLVLYPIFSRLFWRQMVETEVYLDFLHKSTFLWKHVCLFEKCDIDNIIYWYPYCINFFVDTFYIYFKRFFKCHSLCFSLSEIIMYSYFSLVLLESAVKSVSAFATSETCNK